MVQKSCSLTFDLAVSHVYVLYTKVGRKQPQMAFPKEIRHSLLKYIKHKGSPVSRFYFVHHKSLDMSCMEGQHYWTQYPQHLIKLHRDKTKGGGELPLVLDLGGCKNKHL